MKFRRLVDLTNEEIKYIFSETHDETNIVKIERDEINDRIKLFNSETWCSTNGEIVNRTDLMEYELNYNKICCDDIYEHWADEINYRYQQYLLAKGCNYLFKNNKYLAEYYNEAKQ